MGKVGGTKAKQSVSRRTKADTSMSAEITLLLNTLRELAAIRSTAEDAAARILDSAEGLLTLADKEEAKKAEEAILSIMTACGFHDLVGQRVSKITKTLDHVIARRLSGEETGMSSGRLDTTTALEGPSHHGMTQDQDWVDALFRETKN